MSVNTRPRVVLVNRCFVRREDGRLLLLRRAPDKENNADKWEVPGGKVDEGQDLVRAQEREVMEETGLLVQAIVPLVFVDSYLIGAGRYKGLPYVALFSITKLLGGNLTISDEHTDFTWVSYEEMLTFDLTHQVKKAAIVLKPHLIP